MSVGQLDLITGAEIQHVEPDRDCWETPEALVRALSRRFGPRDLDVAASAQNRQAPAWIDVASNALAASVQWHGAVWCNPPYSDIEPWVRKAIAEADEHHVDNVLLLLPSRSGPVLEPLSVYR